MTPNDLQQYLHDKIPLSSAMQVLALEVNDHRVRLGAPLAPNLNHRATIFGGSASAVAILSAWSLLHVRLCNLSPVVSIVLQRHAMHFERPMLGAFVACASLAAPEEWPKFLRMLGRWGKARVVVNSVLECAGENVGQFSGEFVAITE